MLMQWMNWTKEILRSPEDEGGGGAGYGGGGDADDAPAASDRASKLESRLEEISSQLAGFMSKASKQEADTQVQRTESVIRAAVDKAQKAVDAAEATLAKALDDGDGAVIAKAQRELSLRAAELVRTNAEADQVRATLKKQERRTGGSSGGDGTNLDTSNLDNWKAKHSSWYGVDKEMTKAAHEIDAKIREAGVIVTGSKEYFDAVDRQMSSMFPDRLSGSPQTGSRSSGPTTPGQAPKQTRIAASVADGYRRMGINIDDPKVAERMVARRQQAVNKGFLPATPVTGRIIER
jgi:hypothetical protein